jgi:hypothetical protein
MLAQFLAGLAALLVAALLVLIAIVCWAVIRRPAIRYAAMGMCAVLLFGNAILLMAGGITADSRQARFVSLCSEYAEPEVFGRRDDVSVLLADYNWAAYRTDPAALYAGNFFPTYLLQKFLFAPHAPYPAHAARVGKVFEVVRYGPLGQREEKRQAEMPDAMVGYHWEQNSLGGTDVASFDLVVTDLITNERLGVLHTFGIADHAAALFPAMAVGRTPGQFARTRRCPSLERTAEFLREVARP